MMCDEMVGYFGFEANISLLSFFELHPQLIRTFGNLRTRAQNELGNNCAKWKEKKEVRNLENY